MTGGQQVLTLAKECVTEDTIIHELMHALGFQHEQTRFDRDQHINIYYSNVIPGMSKTCYVSLGNLNYCYNFIIFQLEHNFDKPKEGEGDHSYFGTPYDLNSIMHYESTAFGLNGIETMLKKSGGSIVVNTQLTKYDIIGVKKRYGCSIESEGNNE